MTEESNGIDIDRVHIKNIPSFIGFKQFKKILEKSLGDLKTKKIRHMSDYAYVTFNNAEDAQQAISILNGTEIKKHVLSAQLAATEVKDFRAPTNIKENGTETEPKVVKTARESVTPLADETYEKQLEIKQENCKKTMDKLYSQLRDNRIPDIGKMGEFRNRLQKVIEAPKTSEYRNKCEFTIGLDLNGEICVGFVGGRFSKNQHYVIPIEGVDIVSRQMKSIVNDVHEFVKESGILPFDEFERKGFWRMLTIREFGGDVMLIFTVFPQEEGESNIENEIKAKILARYLNQSTLSEKKFRISSIYWQRVIHCSDPVVFELVGGTPYIYETLLDCRFRVSPAAFFQTNSQAASVLYQTIGELCGLTESKSEIISTIKQEEVKEEEEEGLPEKRIKLDDAEVSENQAEVKEVEKDYGTILLDICCGTGTIGQCLLKNLDKSIKVCCIGIEMIAEAVEDAKQNSKQNKMESSCKYIAGKAEDVFRTMKYHVPIQFDLRKSRLVGVLDPPRAGMHEKVILACRELDTLRRLIFVSCEPNAAIKNIVDLCRQTSRKFGGEPFKISKIQPVDMFPQTNHVEWIIQLDR
ncbi:unnamed protein product [Caenorhabditis angaria]|uniref:tRNA (uracil(54)-C(5))-methyltransferase n=1 Tax=Caenorhabditis angaria TaxID=860376 RepID=A0A9P1IVG2_9PELO|nr:unnamed protein product [Caenorhabditis angaria]